MLQQQLVLHSRRATWRLAFFIHFQSSWPNITGKYCHFNHGAPKTDRLSNYVRWCISCEAGTLLMTFFLIEIKFSLPRAKQKSHRTPPFEWVTLGLSNKPARWWIYRHYSWRGVCLESATVLADMSHGLSLSILARLRVLEMCKRGLESPSPLFARCLRAGYLSLQQAATRLLHLIVSSAHSRWEGPTSRDRAPRQWYTCSAAAGVAALFFLRSPRGIRHRGGARVIWRRGREKINDKWLGFFHQAP